MTQRDLSIIQLRIDKPQYVVLLERERHYILRPIFSSLIYAEASQRNDSKKCVMMDRNLTRTAVRIYGTLSELGNGANDILGKLLPFFEPILELQNGQMLDPCSFARQVSETYKWNFNTDIVEAFLPSLEQAGWIEEDNAVSSTRHKAYRICLRQPHRSQLIQNEAVEELAQLGIEFKEFSEKLSPLTALPLSKEVFEDILIEWLLYVEAFSEHSIDFRIKTVTTPGETLSQEYILPKTTKLTDDQIFLCARFVQHAIKTNPDLEAKLTKLASIGLLTEVVQDFVKPTMNIQRTNLVVYLDAPAAMELLGLSGHDSKANIQLVVNELQRVGSEVRIYSKSIEEIQRVLQATLQSDNPSGPTVEAIRNREVYRDFVIKVARDPEYFLGKLFVQTTHRTLDQEPSSHRYFTEEHNTELYGALPFIKRKEAREHDTTITTLLMRQRRGQTSNELFKSGFVLLTSNGALVQAVQRTCRDLGMLPRNKIPPVVHRRAFTTAIWLQTGLRTSLEVPKRLILANCERVLATNPRVVKRVRELVGELGDERKLEQLELLITQPRANQMIMDKTFGVPSVITPRNIETLLADLKSTLVEEEQIRSKTEIDNLEKSKNQELAKFGDRLRCEKEKNVKLLEEQRKAEDEDIEVVGALINETNKTIATKNRFRVILGFGISIIIAVLAFIPDVVQILWIRVVMIIPTAIFGFLTLTGYSLLPISISEERGRKILCRLARERKLEAKLKRANVEWTSSNRFSLIWVPKEETD